MKALPLFHPYGLVRASVNQDCKNQVTILSKYSIKLRTFINEIKNKNGFDCSNNNRGNALKVV